MRPAVKICGVTRVADAERAVELGARWIGLNFHPPSPRSVAVEAARAIAEAVRGRAELVGVFVNRPPAEVEAVAAAVGLDRLQFHGDEGPEVLRPYGARAIKVFRTRGDDLSSVSADAYPEAWGFLFDIHHASLYGGTGIGWPYRRIAGLVRDRPVLVAGGIGPGNARQALAESGADGIDVCSGVESSPGIKDPLRMAKLFAQLEGVTRHAI